MCPKLLAEVVLNGVFERDSILARLLEVDVARRFFGGFVERLVGEFGEGGRPSVRVVREWIEEDRGFVRKNRKGWEVEVPFVPVAEMGPDMRVSAGWRVPDITSLGRLANWLEVEPDKLGWYVGDYGVVDAGSALSHYTT